VQQHINSLEGKWRKVQLLINNAGLAVGKGSFEDGVYDDWERMIDTNIKGLAYMSKEVAALFIENGQGHIINIGSMAGHEVYPGGNMYCATKHAVIALSKGMRIDLVKYNIKVSVVSPGATETEFSIVRFKGDEAMAMKTYEGYEPLSANDVMESVYFIASQPDHVNIDEIYLTPKAQASPFVLERKV
jgi:NADP-dependent 3-hydroxy acid dehydrogenase YdfG